MQIFCMFSLRADSLKNKIFTLQKEWFGRPPKKNLDCKKNNKTFDAPPFRKNYFKQKKIGPPTKNILIIFIKIIIKCCSNHF